VSRSNGVDGQTPPWKQHPAVSARTAGNNFNAPDAQALQLKGRALISPPPSDNFTPLGHQRQISGTQVAAQLTRQNASAASVYEDLPVRKTRS
jgi:hypothetical protein